MRSTARFTSLAGTRGSPWQVDGKAAALGSQLDGHVTCRLGTLEIRGMLIPAPFIEYLAKEVTKRLGKQACAIKHPDRVSRDFESIVLDELSLEDEINAEARALLSQYSEYMRHQDISYHEMFSRVKRQILAERKVVSAAADGRRIRTMKLSRDKVLEISHKMAAKLPRIQGTRLNKGWNDTRLEIQRHLTDILMLEEKSDRMAKRKITLQKREIPEGSEEWQVLHRNYYEDELKKLGVRMARETSETSN